MILMALSELKFYIIAPQLDSIDVPAYPSLEEAAKQAIQYKLDHNVDFVALGMHYSISVNNWMRTSAAQLFMPVFGKPGLDRINIYFKNKNLGSCINYFTLSKVCSSLNFLDHKHLKFVRMFMTAGARFTNLYFDDPDKSIESPCVVLPHPLIIWLCFLIYVINFVYV